MDSEHHLLPTDRHAPASPIPSAPELLRCPGVPATWAYPRVPLSRLLADAVADFPQRPALACGDGAVLDHVEMVRVVEQLALGLRAAGVQRVIVAGASNLAVVLVAHAAWRAGIVLHLDPRLRDLEDGHDLAECLPDFDHGTDVVIGPTRAARALGVARDALIVDDLSGSVLAQRGTAGRFAAVRRRLRRRRSAASLATMIGSQLHGALPPVHPDDVAVEQVTADGEVHLFTHAHLLVAVFQVRLWVPDMGAGCERVAVGTSLARAADLVVGPVLAALVGGTALVHDRGDPARALATATIAVAPGSVWQEVAAAGGRRGRRQRVPTDLRIGGVLVAPEDEVLAAAVVRDVVGHTAGARLRHFWVVAAAAGPVVAQPVYGRIDGLPGALALPDVEVRRSATGVRARGPQFADVPATRVWHDVVLPVPRGTEPETSADDVTPGPSTVSRTTVAAGHPGPATSGAPLAVGTTREGSHS